MASIGQRIERAETERQFGLFDRYCALAAPSPRDRAKAESERRGRAQRQRPVEGIKRGRVVAWIEKPDHEAGNGERRGIVAPGSDRQARMAQRSGLFRLEEAAAQVALLVTPGDDGVSDSQFRFELDCPLKKPERPIGIF